MDTTYRQISFNQKLSSFPNILVCLAKLIKSKADLIDYMEENNPNTEKNSKDSPKSWIAEVAKHSWEPELLIAGAAIYASSKLPGFIHSSYETYTTEYMIGATQIDAIIPALIYGVFMTISQLLVVTFALHFVIRSFWVGMVGLLSVFPEGIQYHKIKSMSEYELTKTKDRLGSVDNFILRVDQLCSIVFSVSFMIVLLLIGIGVLYIGLFMLLLGSKLVLPEEMIKGQEVVILSVFGGVFLLFGLFMVLLQTKRFKEKPAYQKMRYRLGVSFSKIIFPFIYRPLQYILLTFFSNVSKKRLILAGVLVFLMFYALFIYNMSFGLRDLSIERRTFYSKGTNEYTLKAGFYENLRPKEKLRKVTIQADVIKDRYVKLFIAYRRTHDYFVNKICKPYVYNKKLSIEENNQLRNAHNLQCFSSYYQIYLNGVAYKKTEFIYYQYANNEDKGLLAYIPVGRLKSGKNLIQVKTKVNTIRRKKKKYQRKYLYTIPFWIE